MIYKTTNGKEIITVQTLVRVPVDFAFKLWNDPEHIKQWNAASEDWHTPEATVDFRVDGEFDYRMEAKNGSFGFNLKGTYTEIFENESIDYVLEDGRKVSILFAKILDGTRIIETFEAETQNPIELQRQGWQAILDHFQRHAEAAFQQ